MPNPFDSLVPDISDQVEYELVEDSVLACKECKVIVREGRYYESQELLTWVCPKGHKSQTSIKL